MASDASLHVIICKCHGLKARWMGETTRVVTRAGLETKGQSERRPEYTQSDPTQTQTRGISFPISNISEQIMRIGPSWDRKILQLLVYFTNKLDGNMKF